jgi:hypothetical protein
MCATVIDCTLWTFKLYYKKYQIFKKYTLNVNSVLILTSEARFPPPPQYAQLAGTVTAEDISDYLIYHDIKFNNLTHNTNCNRYSTTLWKTMNSLKFTAQQCHNRCCHLLTSADNSKHAAGLLCSMERVSELMLRP